MDGPVRRSRVPGRVGGVSAHPLLPTPAANADAAASADDATAALLRVAVGRLRTRQGRRSFHPTLHVGRLGGRHAGFVVRPGDRPDLDRGVRTEVVARLLQHPEGRPAGADPLVPPAAASVWLTRPGAPCEEDEDHSWHAAARSACAVFHCTLEGFWLVTPTGWLDLATGESRRWTRLRL